MINNVTIAIPVISTIRYNDIKAVKVKGMKQINDYFNIC